MLLERVDSPADLKALSPEDTQRYVDELREFLIRSVTATGGHLGSNLGVVELTVALHRVFDFSTDPPTVLHVGGPHQQFSGDVAALCSYLA